MTVSPTANCRGTWAPLVPCPFCDNSPLPPLLPLLPPISRALSSPPSPGLSAHPCGCAGPNQCESPPTGQGGGWPDGPAARGFEVICEWPAEHTKLSGIPPTDAISETENGGEGLSSD